jgi:heat-inducible transcriptional repressor
VPIKRGGMKLTEREETILKIIVDEYTKSSEPVGSRYVSKSGFISLSPASVRNVMSDLEDKGFICQPHTSAGRIPTDLGYRYYIDKIVEFNVDGEYFSEILEDIEASNITGLFNKVSHRLGTITKSVGFVVSPKLNTMYLKHIEFMRLNDENVIAIIVTQSGMVHNVLLNIDMKINDSELVRISNYLNEKFVKKTLQEVKDFIATEVIKEKKSMDEMLKHLEVLASKLFERADFGEDLIIQGTNNIVEIPEFNRDLSKLKTMLNFFEEKSFIYKILDKCMNEDGIKIFIGSEIGVDKTDDLGLVLKPYQRGGKVIGTLGVIGPKRMNYGKVVSIVDYTAEVISNVLSSIGEKK